MKLEQLKNNIQQDVITDSKSIENILKEMCNMEINYMYNNAMQKKYDLLDRLLKNINIYQKGEYSQYKLSDLIIRIKKMQVEANHIKHTNTDVAKNLNWAYSNVIYYLASLVWGFLPDKRKNRR